MWITQSDRCLSNRLTVCPTHYAFLNVVIRHLHCPVSLVLTRMASVSFSGGSYFAVTYNAGVLQSLQDHFDLSSVVFLGASSGALVACAAVVGMHGREHLEKRQIPACERLLAMPYKGVGHWRRVMDDVWKQSVLATEQGFWQQNSNTGQKRLYISLTVVEGCSVRNELVSAFSSLRDVVDCVWTSCHVPFLLTESFSVQWRGCAYVDGGITDNQPVLDAQTCRVHPHMWRSHMFWAKHGCFSVPTAEQARWAFELGIRDAEAHRDYFVEGGLVAKQQLMMQLRRPPRIDTDYQDTQDGGGGAQYKWAWPGSLLQTIYKLRFLLYNVACSRLFRNRLPRREN